jgi:DNA-binding response OmpR family regulator
MSSTRKSVLIVEDQRDLAAVVERHLVDMGCDVQVTGDGLSALRLVDHRHFDLVLLDLMLPGIDGLEVCRRLRARGTHVFILMLTAKSSELDKIVGLEVGADDYLTKPFSIKELIARVKAIFRRMELLAAAPAEDPQLVQLGDVLQIDPVMRKVRAYGCEVELTGKEFDLLLHFARNPGRVYSRAQLLDAAWGYSHDGYDHAVNCHINRLRAKIERDHRHPELIQTVWGVGYKMTDKLTHNV